MTLVQNTKWKCDGCGGIFHFDSTADFVPCTNCGGTHYTQIAMIRTCDFCGVTGDAVTQEIPCASFRVDNAGVLPDDGYSGPWAACDDCARDVTADDRQELAVRAVRIAIEKEPQMQVIADILHQEIRGLHDLFFIHREGDPRPYTEEVMTDA